MKDEKSVQYSTSHSKPREGGEQHRGTGLRAELRGMDYAAGVQRLTPKDVQQKKANGSITPQTREATEGGQVGAAESHEEAAPSPKSFTHWLQSTLNDVLATNGLAGEPLVVDGLLGPNTRRAIRAFQKGVATIAPSERGIRATGSLDPLTLGAIERATGDKNPFGRESAPPAAAPAAIEVAPVPAAAPVSVDAPTPEAEAEADAKEASPTDPPAPTLDGIKDDASSPNGADAADKLPEAGAEVNYKVPLTDREVAEAKADVMIEQAKVAPAKTPAKDADGAGLDALLAQRLEKARSKIGTIGEIPFSKIPPHMPSGLHDLFRARMARNIASAKPGETPTGIYFAKDTHSLARLSEMAAGVQLDYAKQAVTSGYQWCGSFIAEQYEMTAHFEFVSDKKTDTRRKPAKSSKANGNTYLASTPKSEAFFSYSGEWNGAYIRDLSVPETAPVAQSYVPIRAYHAMNGGERQWLPLASWAQNPVAACKPGMVLFVNATKRYPTGAHMILIDYVAPDGKGGWLVHTVEGNGKGAGVSAFSYPISASGKSPIVAMARPSAKDFDKEAQMCDSQVYQRKLAEEAGQ